MGGGPPGSLPDPEGGRAPRICVDVNIRCTEGSLPEKQTSAIVPSSTEQGKVPGPQAQPHLGSGTRGGGGCLPSGVGRLVPPVSSWFLLCVCLTPPDPRRFLSPPPPSLSLVLSPGSCCWGSAPGICSGGKSSKSSSRAPPAPALPSWAPGASRSLSVPGGGGRVTSERTRF